jgi:hypothetical protein
MKWVTVILITILVSACGGVKQVQSNVTVTEYVVRDRVVHDTVPVMRDTTIYRDSVRIEIRYIKGVAGGETNMAVKAECPPSKVRVVTQTVTSGKEKEERKPWWTEIIWPITFIVAIAILIKSLLK